MWCSLSPYDVVCETDSTALKKDFYRASSLLFHKEFWGLAKPKQEAHRPRCSGCGACNALPQMSLTCTRLKYQHAFSIHPWDPNFRLFRSTMSRFWVTAQLLEKCTERPKWPWHVQGQKYQHAANTPEAQTFVRFALWWAIFDLQANFWKSAPNDPKWPWHFQSQKYQHACYIHCQGPNLHQFHSTMSHFWVTVHFMEKCTEWPQMALTCSRSKIRTCMLHTPTRAKFSICFVLGWAVFELRINFRSLAIW